MLYLVTAYFSWMIGFLCNSLIVSSSWSEQAYPEEEGGRISNKLATYMYLDNIATVDEVSNQFVKQYHVGLI